MVDSCTNECKELNSLSDSDQETIEKLKELESALTKSFFLTGDMITPSDITTFDEIETMNLDIPAASYPKILKWMKEINRLKMNWRISKRPDKGRTFNEYIQKSQKKINELKVQYDNDILNKSNKSKEILNFSKGEEKEIATIHFNPKKDSGYELKIKVKFLPFKEGQGMSLAEISSKLAIVTHSYLKNKTDIQPNKNDKGELTAEITSMVDNEEWDIEPLAQDLKRNVNGVFNVEIISIKKL